MDVHLPLEFNDLESLILSKYRPNKRQLAALVKALSLMHENAGPSRCFELSNRRLCKVLKLRYISCSQHLRHRPLAVLIDLGLLAVVREQQGTAKGIYCLTYPEMALYTYQDAQVADYQ